MKHIYEDLEKNTAYVHWYRRHKPFDPIHAIYCNSLGWRLINMSWYSMYSWYFESFFEHCSDIAVMSNDPLVFFQIICWEVLRGSCAKINLFLYWANCLVFSLKFSYIPHLVTTYLIWMDYPMCKTVPGTMLESEIASIKIIPHVAFTFTNLFTYFGDASVYFLVV